MPEPGYEQLAEQLSQLGLLRVEHHEFVRCVNGEDDDLWDVTNEQCGGRIRLSPDLDEDAYDYWCPDCERPIFPSEKQSAFEMSLYPEPVAIRAYLRSELEAVKVDVREDPVGLYRLSGKAGEVQVCIPDFCPDPAVYEPGYAQRDALVFVLGNERDYARLLPPHARVFPLVALALGESRQAFRRELRRRLRLDDQRPRRPGVIRSGRGLPAACLGTSRPPSAAPPETAIPTPKGTRWADIDIYRVDGHTIAVKVKGQRRKQYGCVQLGMAKKRNAMPTKQWDLLDALCMGHGTVPSPGKANAGTFRQRVARLRPQLQKLFGIDDDPLPPCGPGEGARTAFRAHPELPIDTYVGDVLGQDPRQGSGGAATRRSRQAPLQSCRPD